MPSVYNLKIKASLDTSQVQQQLNKLKVPGSGGGGARGGTLGASKNIESAAMTVNFAALSRVINTLGNDFADISNNLGNSGLARSISETTKSLSDAMMAYRMMGRFGAALVTATEILKGWSAEVKNAKNWQHEGKETVEEVDRRREREAYFEEYRQMSDPDRNARRRELTTYLSESDAEIRDLGLELSQKGVNYDEYLKTAKGFVQGALGGGSFESFINGVVGATTGGQFKSGVTLKQEEAQKIIDRMNFLRQNRMEAETRIKGLDAIEREETDERKAIDWRSLAPELAYVGNMNFGGGLAAMGGSMGETATTQEDQLKELREIRTLVGYMRNVMSEQGFIATYE